MRDQAGPGRRHSSGSEISRNLLGCRFCSYCLQLHPNHLCAITTGIRVMEWTTFSGLRREFGLSRSTSGRLIAAKLITAKRLGRRMLINVPSVREFLHHLPDPELALDARAVRLHKKFGVNRTQIASTGDVQTQEAQTAA